MPKNLGFFDRLAFRKGKKSVEAEVEEEEREAAEENGEYIEPIITDVKGESQKRINIIVWALITYL